MALKITRLFKKERRPTTLVVEATNRCNLNCPFCLVGMQNEYEDTGHDSMQRRLGAMDLALFDKIMEQAREFGIKKVQLHFQGEPFMNKALPEMISRAKQKKFFVQAFTNGQLLNNRELLEKLSATGLDMLRFSVDGASEDTYQQNRVGGKFANVFEAMKLASELLTGTRLEWQFLALANNEHEIETARKLAGELGMGFVLKTLAPTVPELIPKDPGLRREPKPKPCLDIYTQVCVYWDGRVVPCCFDVDARQVMGDLNESSLNRIWESEGFRQFREKVDRVEDSDIDICRDCLRWS